MQRDRRLFCQHALALGTAAVAAPAWAQNEKFPSKPIKVVVPYPAGGQTDTIARIACTSAAQTLGQPVLVDNRPEVARLYPGILTEQATIDDIMTFFAKGAYDA